VNDALATVSYTPDSEVEGADTLHISSLSTEEAAVGGDVSGTALATVAITVDGTADTPVISAPASASTTEDVSTPISGLSLSTFEASANDGDDAFTAAPNVEPGTLSAPGPGITGTGTAGAPLVITGSLSDVNDPLATV